MLRGMDIPGTFSAILYMVDTFAFSSLVSANEAHSKRVEPFSEGVNKYL